MLFANVLDKYIMSFQTQGVGVMLGKLEDTRLLATDYNTEFALCNILQKCLMIGRLFEGVIKKVVGVPVNCLRAKDKNTDEGKQSNDNDNENSPLGLGKKI
jgi:hypothetical protein